MITLYSLEHSRSDRINWILKVLGLDYTEEVYARDPKTQLADSALKKIHPSGKAPVLKDGDLVIAESGLIVEYLVEKYGKGSELEAKTEQESLHIREGIIACESNMMIGLMQLYINSIARQKMPWGVGYIVGKALDQIEAGYARKEVISCLNNLQDTVRKNGGYFSNGHLSGADIMYNLTIAMLGSVKVIPNFETKYKDLWEYHQRVQKRIDESKGGQVTVVDKRSKL